MERIPFKLVKVGWRLSEEMWEVVDKHGRREASTTEVLLWKRVVRLKNRLRESRRCHGIKMLRGGK